MLPYQILASTIHEKYIKKLYKNYIFKILTLTFINSN